MVRKKIKSRMMEKGVISQLEDMFVALNLGKLIK